MNDRDREMKNASVRERLELVAQEAGVTVDDVIALLRILHDNGGTMRRVDLERAWVAERRSAASEASSALGDVVSGAPEVAQSDEKPSDVRGGEQT